MGQDGHLIEYHIGPDAQSRAKPRGAARAMTTPPLAFHLGCKAAAASEVALHFTQLMNTLRTCATTTLKPTFAKPQLGTRLRHVSFKVGDMSSEQELKIENTNIKTSPGVDLNDQQKTLVGSVLDLFAGRPSLAKLQLWADDATFEDPIAIAKGRKQFEPQWYGLQTAFSQIERLSHEVTSSGNPLTMDLKTRYVVKGINQEKIIDSKVNIFVDAATGKITKLQDKWNGELPDGSVANAFRRLNASTMPHVVSVPKNAEEDAQRGN